MTAPIALTSGDPAGVGPEITLMAWDALRGQIPFFVIGDADALADLPNAPAIRRIASPAEAIGAETLPVMHLPSPVAPRAGQPELRNAAATISSIDRGVALAMAGQAGGVTTNPINKKVLVDGAGFAHPGHTEYLAELGGVDRSVMMLAAPELKVVPVTIHIPIAEVPAALTPDLLAETLRIVHAAMRRDFGLSDPRIAVAGLNPHAGEGGLMGTEDAAVIAPVLDSLRAEGMTLTGPLPADTMFHPAARARYDVAVCMYHDQALIPIKTLDFDRGVNVTLGLPFVRTSPDHGTAYDIAGKGIADPQSLIEALRLAWEMAERRTGAA